MPDVAGATALLADRLRPGDVVLVKASRGIGLDRLASALLTPAPGTGSGTGATPAAGTDSAPGPGTGHNPVADRGDGPGPTGTAGGDDTERKQEEAG